MRCQGCGRAEAVVYYGKPLREARGTRVPCFCVPCFSAAYQDPVLRRLTPASRPPATPAPPTGEEGAPSLAAPLSD